jgi:hypothetical protein
MTVPGGMDATLTACVVVCWPLSLVTVKLTV